MKWILLGYRGCGKTTVGRLLAQSLQIPFYDVDEQNIARFAGQPIADIWKQHGEPAYRAVEVQVTSELCQLQDAVLSLGGGTLMQAGARQAVESATDAKRFYLCGPAALLYQRIYADPASAHTRPALTPMGGGVEEIITVLAQRDPVYRAVADHVIEIMDLSPFQIAEMIQKLGGKQP
ncbi:MAG: shikimate kinase [Phycisphaerales bacterium]|nr:shikimate kinase [Phycisphaerales bacterium]